MLHAPKMHSLPSRPALCPGGWATGNAYPASLVEGLVGFGLLESQDFGEANKAVKSQKWRMPSLSGVSLVCVSLSLNTLSGLPHSGDKGQGTHDHSLPTSVGITTALPGKDLSRGSSKAPALPGLTCPSSPRDGNGFPLILVSEPQLPLMVPLTFLKPL